MERRVKVYLTDIRNGRRLSEETPLVFKADKPGNDGNEGHVLNVYDQVKYQEILGFGGAFTQAAAVNYKKLDEAIQAVGKAEGVVYIFDLARTPIPYVGAQSVDVTAKVKTQLGIK